MSRKNPDTRSRILEAALALLEDGGGQGVRMADIARRAGVSRQAVYLHFATRAELLDAATLYLDELSDSRARLAPSRAAASGLARLDAYVEAWACYIPEIYGVARALMAMRDSDEAAAAAWDRRMADMREGCAAAIAALQADGTLAPGQDADRATDLLWVVLSVRNWELLTRDCGWSQQHYVATMKTTARRLFVADGAGDAP